MNDPAPLSRGIRCVLAGVWVPKRAELQARPYAAGANLPPGWRAGPRNPRPSCGHQVARAVRFELTRRTRESASGSSVGCSAPAATGEHPDRAHVEGVGEDHYEMSGDVAAEHVAPDRLVVVAG